jgi:hypothetical protein
VLRHQAERCSGTTSPCHASSSNPQALDAVLERREYLPKMTIDISQMSDPLGLLRLGYTGPLLHLRAQHWRRGRGVRAGRDHRGRDSRGNRL